uniref:Ion transport domain-containing protein n=1 Tax=Anopheles atroparvus TaxID=41427 RepID=A0AAG5DPJ8_ANOAO
MHNQVEISRAQRSLVAALNEHWIDGFERALKNVAKVDLSVFEEACSTPGKSAFIKKCIYYGGELNQRNSDAGKCPIHLAAESYDEMNLLVLLNQPTLLIDEETSDGNTALCLLFETTSESDESDELKKSKESKVFDCAKLLLTNHANINKPSNNGKMPIQVLMDNSFLTDQFKTDILSFCSTNCFLNVSQETRTTIQNKYNVEIPEYTAQHKHFDELRDVLHNFEDEQIVAGFKINNPKTIEFPEEMIRKLLEMCIYRCKPLTAQQIISSRLDNGKLNNPSKLLNELLAKCCKLGACEMLQSLLDIIPEGSIDFLNQDPLLLYVVENMDSMVHKNSCGFCKCMEILLRDPRIEIDKRDGLNRTALQMAGICKNDHAQKLLLAQGAYIGGRDIDGYHTIDELNPEVLKKHFDECVGDSINGTKQVLEVNVRNLVLPKLKSVYKEHTYKHSTDNTFHNAFLALLGSFVVGSVDRNQIISHPVISCWLHLSWHRYKKRWLIEILLCSVFVGCFYGYLMRCFQTESSTTEWYTIVLVVLVLFIGSILIYWVVVIQLTDERKGNGIFTVDSLGLTKFAVLFSSVHTVVFDISDRTSWIVYVVFFVIFVFIMFSVLSELWRKKRILLLFLMGFIFLSLISAHFFLDEDIRRIIASFTAVGLGCVFILTLDTVESYSVSTNILMLEVVLTNLMRFMIPGGILLSTFAVGFCTLLKKNDNAQLAASAMVFNVTASENEAIRIEKEFHSFNQLRFAIPKLATMMTGELNVANMQLTNGPFIIMLILFVLSVTIAFHNLMIGSAVSDVADVRAKSTLLGIRKRIEKMYQYENVFRCNGQIDQKCCGSDFIHRIKIETRNIDSIEVHSVSKPNRADAEMKLRWNCTTGKTIVRALQQITASTDSRAKCMWTNTAPVSMGFPHSSAIKKHPPFGG